RTTVSTASSSWRTAPISVDDNGASPGVDVETPDGAGTAGMFDEYSLSAGACANAAQPAGCRFGEARCVRRRLSSSAIEFHEEAQHVPEQRRDRREQHQRCGDVARRREVAHHQAGLIEDVA